MSLSSLKEAIQYYEEFIFGYNSHGEVIADVDAHLVVFLELGLKNLDSIHSNDQKHRVEEMFLRRVKRAWPKTLRAYAKMDWFEKRAFCIEYWTWIDNLRQLESSIGPKTYKFLASRGTYINKVLMSEVTKDLSLLKGQIKSEDFETLHIIAAVNMDNYSLMEFRLFMRGEAPRTMMTWLGDRKIFEIFKAKLRACYASYILPPLMDRLVKFWFKLL